MAILPRWRALLATSVFVLGGAGAGWAAEARLPGAALDRLTQKIELRYSVTGAGFAILTADVTIEMRKRHYQASTMVKTDGIAGLMMESRWDTVTEGEITPTGLKPKTYRIDVATRTGRGAVQVKWQGDKQEIAAVPKFKPDRAADLKAKLTVDMPDPLSAIVTAAMFSADRPCTGTARAFDGRRIHDLHFKFQRPVIIKGGGHYEGPALRCQVKHTPVAGQPPDELEAERRSPSPYHTVWLAPAVLGKGAPKALIPVRIEMEGDWGTTVVHLVRSTIDGRPMKVALSAPK